jgi:hypothetical protein
MNNIVDLSKLTTPQLKEIRRVIADGIVASAGSKSLSDREKRALERYSHPRFIDNPCETVDQNVIEKAKAKEAAEKAAEAERQEAENKAKREATTEERKKEISRLDLEWDESCFGVDKMSDKTFGFVVQEMRDLKAEARQKAQAAAEKNILKVPSLFGMAGSDSSGNPIETVREGLRERRNNGTHCG